jgi:signal transduction histidine kinase
VRLRIALVSAALFLVVGGALLILTHVLLAESLPTPTKAGIGLVITNGPNGPRSINLNTAVGAGKVAAGGNGNTVIGGSSSGRTSARITTHANAIPPRFAPSPVQAGALQHAKHLSKEVAQALQQAQQHVYTYSVDQRNGTLAHLWWFGGIALAVTTLLAFLFSWILARRALRPLHLMSDTARRISHDNLTERIRLGGRPDELTELADTFDQLIDRLQASFAAQAQFAANASHELRTPLAIERTVADVALDDTEPTVEDLQDALRKIRAVGVRSEHLVDSLLTLAKSSLPVEHDVALDLAELVSNQLAKLQPDVEERSLLVAVDCSEAPVSGDAVLIEQAVANLLQNAVRHNVSGGEIHVTTFGDGDSSVLKVENNGDPLDPEVVRHLVEPFRRARAERTAVSEGAGLGLSIVSAIATAHGGAVTLRSRNGGGLCAELRLHSRSIDRPAH